MKAKISVVFFVLAVLLVVGVLKRDLFSPPQEVAASPESLKEFSKADVFRYLETSAFFSYSGDNGKIDIEKINSADIVNIHFWASWCAPCVNEVPELIEFAQRITKKNEKNLKVLFISVSLDEGTDELNKFIKSFPDFNKDPFIRIWDKDKSFSKLVNADRLPMTVILNKNIAEPRVVRGVVEWKSIHL